MSSRHPVFSGNLSIPRGYPPNKSLTGSFSAPNSKGQDGLVSASFIQSGALEKESKQSYPFELLDIMRRQAEDLLLSNSYDQKGRDVLEFIVNLANERSDLEQMKEGEIS